MVFHSPLKLCLLSSSSTGNLLDRVIFYSLRHSQQLNFCTATRLKPGPKPTFTREHFEKQGSRIARLLNIDEKQGRDIFQAAAYVAKVKDENILQVMKVLEKFQVPPSYVLTYPRLLCTKPISLESDIAICNEIGIKLFQGQEAGTDKMCIINRYRLLKFETVATLKSKKLLPHDCDVTKKLVNLLEMNDEAVHNLYEFLPISHDNIHLQSLRYHIMSYYLSSALNCSLRDAQIIINRYASSDHRSFEKTRQVLKILQNKFLFTSKMIINCDAIFKAHPVDLLELYNTVKTISHEPALKVIQSRPKIILQRASALQEIEKLILEDFGYPVEALKRRPEIYTLCARTIRKRLEEIETIPHFKTLKSHPASLSIVYYFNKVKQRTTEIHINKTPYVAPSLHMLTTGSFNYKRFLESGFKPHGKDLIVVLSKYFKDKKRSQIRNYLSVHPHWIDVPINEAEGVIKYISSIEEISEDSLFDALPIILYPIEKVKDCINTTVESGEATLKDSYFLQMVLYFLEKSVHFTGDGIWRGTSTQIPPSKYEDVNNNSEFDFILNEADINHSEENPHQEE